MRCENCNKRPATVHLTDLSKDGEKRSVHLCEECAKEQGSTMELLGLISGAFPAREPGKTDPATQTCGECGLRYQEFRARGRLGCPKCYEAFKRALDPLLEKIHGGSQHVGKAPDAGSAVDRSRERRLVELRRSLQAAIREERYEAAAGLRDELRAFEDPGATREGGPDADL